MNRILIALFCVFLSLSPVWASEKLLYALRHESIKRYPDIVYTRIYSLDSEGGESQLLFSDERTDIMILPKRGMPGHPGEVLVSSRNRLFAHAVERRLNPGRWYPYKASIYELSVDGSNQFRKLLDVIGEQSLSETCVNLAGTRIAYINYLDQRKFIFVHEIQTGKLLYQFDVSALFLDCFAATIGWLPDGKRLFFTLDTGDVHVTSQESYGKKGTYLVRENGTGLVRLKDELVMVPLERGCYRATDSPPRLIGALQKGSYVFRDFVRCGLTEASEMLYKVNLSTASRAKIPLMISKGLNWFKLSHSGEHLAFTQKSYSRDGRYEWVEDIWVKNLRSGREEKLFSLDNKPFRGYYVGLVGWIQD